MKKSKFIAGLITAGLIVGLSVCPAQAEQLKFADMPNNWSTQALGKAVENGLLKGIPEQNKLYIKADDNLTRAQLLTIVNRAFAAEGKANISDITDAQGMWFTDDIAKAVHMGTWEKSQQIFPNQAATREETFTALAKALNLSSDKYDSLSKFSDAGDISQNNKKYLAAMTDKGYVNGFAGKVNPKANITRAEFAVIMDNIVKQYVATNEAANLNVDGNVVVSSKNVTLKATQIKGDLVIADGVGDGHVVLDNVKVTGRLVARGGGINSIIIQGNSEINTISVAKVDGNIRVKVDNSSKVDFVFVNDGKQAIQLEGKFNNLVVNADTTVNIKNAEIAKMSVNAGASVNMDKATAVKELNLEANAKNGKIELQGKVDKLNVSASNVTIKGDGTVQNANFKKGSDGSKLETKVVKVNVDKDVKNVTGAGNKPLVSNTSTGFGGGGSSYHKTPDERALETLAKYLPKEMYLNKALEVKEENVKTAVEAFLTKNQFKDAEALKDIAVEKVEKKDDVKFSITFKKGTKKKAYTVKFVAKDIVRKAKAKYFANAHGGTYQEFLARVNAWAGMDLSTTAVLQSSFDANKYDGLLVLLYEVPSYGNFETYVTVKSDAGKGVTTTATSADVIDLGSAVTAWAKPADGKALFEKWDHKASREGLYASAGYWVGGQDGTDLAKFADGTKEVEIVIETKDLTGQNAVKIKAEIEAQKDADELALEKLGKYLPKEMYLNNALTFDAENVKNAVGKFLKDGKFKHASELNVITVKEATAGTDGNFTITFQKGEKEKAYTVKFVAKDVVRNAKAKYFAKNTSETYENFKARINAWAGMDLSTTAVLQSSFDANKYDGLLVLLYEVPSYGNFETYVTVKSDAGKGVTTTATSAKDINLGSAVTAWAKPNDEKALFEKWNHKGTREGWYASAGYWVGGQDGTDLAKFADGTNEVEIVIETKDLTGENAVKIKAEI